MAGDLEALLVELQGLEAGPITRAVERLEELLPSLDPADRQRTVDALCGLFYIDLYDREDLQPAVAAAERALTRLGESIIPTLIHMMEGSDFKSHLHLARVLGRIGEPAIPHLSRLVATAEEGYSRSFALYAIGKIRSPEVHRALTEVVGSMMHPDSEVRDSAARTLGKIVDVVPAKTLTERRRSEIFLALSRASTDAQPAVRAKAVRSLGKMVRGGYLSEGQQAQLRGRLDAILGQGNEESWDRAYVVRREAQEALRHLREPGS